MKAVDDELRGLLDWLGVKLLMTESQDSIEITYKAAATIVRALSATPAGKTGRPKFWTAELEARAIVEMLDGTPVNVLAREIAGETGQPERSAIRRLRDLKKSERFKIWRRR